MFKSSIELNKSNSWVLITTFYVLISVDRGNGGDGRRQRVVGEEKPAIMGRGRRYRQRLCASGRVDVEGILHGTEVGEMGNVANGKIARGGRDECELEQKGKGRENRDQEGDDGGKEKMGRGWRRGPWRGKGRRHKNPEAVAAAAAADFGGGGGSGLRMMARADNT